MCDNWRVDQKKYAHHNLYVIISVMRSLIKFLVSYFFHFFYLGFQAHFNPPVFAAISFLVEPVCTCRKNLMWYLRRYDVDIFKSICHLCVAFRA